MINKLPQVCKKYQDLVTRRIVLLVISIIADDLYKSALINFSMLDKIKYN